MQQLAIKQWQHIIRYERGSFPSPFLTRQPHSLKQMLDLLQLKSFCGTKIFWYLCSPFPLSRESLFNIHADVDRLQLRHKGTLVIFLSQQLYSTLGECYNSLTSRDCKLVAVSFFILERLSCRRAHLFGQHHTTVGLSKRLGATSILGHRSTQLTAKDARSCFFIDSKGVY